MAEGEEEEEGGFMDQLRRAMGGGGGGGGGGRVSFVPLIVGMVGIVAGERIVLVNPQTQGMVVVQGDAGMISAILAGAGGDGPPPASRASVAALKTVDLGGAESCTPGEGEEEEEEEEECAICLDGLGTEGAAAKEMPCGHRFHGGCIEKWLGMHGSCPVCRYRMPAEEGEEAKKGGAGAGEEGGGEGERREVWFTIAVGRRRAEREEEEQERGDGDD